MSEAVNNAVNSAGNSALNDAIYIVGAARTAIGSFGGSLKDVPGYQLAAHVVREAVARADADPDSVGEVILGCVNQAGEDAYIPRSAALSADLPTASTAYGVNRMCGSGLQAIWNGVRAISDGQSGLVVAGGVESMSRLPYYLREARWGHRLGHGKLEDGVVSVLTDPISGIHMGVTAENLVDKYGISREEQDRFSYESHMKSISARENGVFDEEIVVVSVPEKRGQTRDFARDEQPRPDTSVEALARLRPLFKENGTVTAGNASPLNDGAAAVALASEAEVKRQGLKPLARIVGVGVAGVEPDVMGYGPVPSTAGLLDKLGLSWDDIDLIELNEAFAAQALAVLKSWPEEVKERVNVNGGAIALGHPLGATGAILTVKLLYELRRRKARYGLVTLCIGGGQGISAVIENVAE